MYKIATPMFGELQPSCVIRAIDSTCIPFYSTNADYQQFKQDVLNGIELQDANGNQMTAEESKNFVATLP